MSETILELKELKTYFSRSDGLWSKAVDGVSFSVKKGETLCVVGGVGVRQEHDGAVHHGPFAQAARPYCRRPDSAERPGFDRAGRYGNVQGARPGKSP